MNEWMSICPTTQFAIPCTKISKQWTWSCRMLSTRCRDDVPRYEGYVRFVDVYRQPLFRWWWLPWYIPDWTTGMVYWSAFRPTWCANSRQSSMLLRDWFSVWNTATILQMRSSAFTGCGFQSGSSTSSLSWRTKCYMDVHQVTSGHLYASPMCLVVEHSAPPTRIASWCHQSRPSQSAVEPSRSAPLIWNSTRRRYRRWVAANLPEKAEKTSILSIVSWLLLLTLTPAVDLAVAVPLRPL